MEETKDLAAGGDDDSDDEDSEDDNLLTNKQTEIDREILEDLYSATMGDATWENVDGWDEGLEDLSDWWGCTLSKRETDEFPGVTPGSLVRIKLYQNGLAGTLPDSLNGLRNIVVLNLHRNLIEGALPELGKLRNLVKLDLGRNRFTGPLPPSYGKLLRLEKLVVQNNLLTGPFMHDLCSLTALKHLDISRNDFTGEVPEDLGYMEPLTVVMVNDNLFTGAIPETVTLLTNLEKLTVQFNEFEVDPHWLLEYIPEDCEFEADEDEICQLECMKKKQELT